jgi:hypothetical protein
MHGTRCGVYKTLHVLHRSPERSRLRSAEAGTSSARISLQRSMHSSQMHTLGPTTSFTTSLSAFLQNPQSRASGGFERRRFGLIETL